MLTGALSNRPRSVGVTFLPEADDLELRRFPSSVIAGILLMLAELELSSFGEMQFAPSTTYRTRIRAQNLRDLLERHSAARAWQHGVRVRIKEHL